MAMKRRTGFAVSPDERALNDPSLAAHRPLGSIMRARLRAYPALLAWRRERNGIPAREPHALDEVRTGYKQQATADWRT
jgi:hypothetical protein